MNEFNLLSVKEHWFPLKPFGYTHPFFNLTIPTLVATWMVLAIIIFITALGRLALRSEKGRLRYLFLTGARTFMDLCTQTLGAFQYNHFSFIFSLFIFILFCNTISIIPEMEEPTADLNTALALGIISFFYTNYYAIKKHGIKEYIKEFFQPFFVMFPIHLVGKFSSIISISFRLFGNMLGGSIISNMYMSAVSTHWLGLLINFCGFGIIIALFFGIFEGAIQAFVFSTLSLTYLSLGLQSEHAEEA